MGIIKRIFKWVKSLFTKTPEQSPTLPYPSLTLKPGVIVSDIDYFIPVEKPKFRIIISYSNVGNWLCACSRSVITQDNPNWTAHFLDDASTDDSAQLIHTDDRIEYIKREKRMYALKNQYEFLKTAPFNDDDIIIFLDGDDTLLRRDALDILEELYDEDTDVVYGQYTDSNGHRGRSSAYLKFDFENLRNLPFRASHLRSFKYKMFKELLDIDQELLHFKNENGFYRMCSDIAIMTPILELAGHERVKFNDIPLYWYRMHDRNDIEIDREEQVNIEKEILGKVDNIRKIR